MDLIKLTKEFISMEKINREMIVLLIDKITVSEDKDVKIYYKFRILNENKKINQNNVVNLETA